MEDLLRPSLLSIEKYIVFKRLISKMNSGKSILRAIWLFSWLASLHTTSAANQPILNIAQSPHTNPQLQKRQPAPFNSMASLAGGQTGSSSSPQAHSPPRDPPNPLNASCIIKPLELKTWQELSLDDYLRNYPKGNTTSLPVSRNLDNSSPTIRSDMLY